MPDIHPNNRPLTISEMFQRLAVMADGNHLEEVLAGMDYARAAIEVEIDRQRPGYSMDKLLGLARKDWHEGERQ